MFISLLPIVTKKLILISMFTIVTKLMLISVLTIVTKTDVNRYVDYSDRNVGANLCFPQSQRVYAYKCVNHSDRNLMFINVLTIVIYILCCSMC